ncbi:MAG: hypothetical protein QOG05_2463 [Streptosporangiaceae bacterium]|jgi:hypothetical protein|nr:hypothetical protein [Streptosporangiaceae bacterium]
MYIPYQFMKAMEDDWLRTAARDGRAAAARHERRTLRRARREQRPARSPERILSPGTAS